MSIELTRIDDKLIHAQILWGWSNLIKPSKIIAVSDEVANDSLKKDILLASAKSILEQTEVKILSLEDSINCSSLKKPESEVILLVLSKPSDAVFLIKNGIDIKKVSLGYMSERPNRERILETVFVNEDDIKAFKELIEIGIELEYQISPLDKPIDSKIWMQ